MKKNIHFRNVFICLLMAIPLAVFAGTDLDKLAKNSLADLTISVPPGKGRPFVLANGSGTYYYGSTSEESWDSGWMGLWVNRKRVMNELRVADENGKAMPFSEAKCVVSPVNVVWTWPNGRTLEIYFENRNNDTLYYEQAGTLKVAPLLGLAYGRESDFTLDSYWNNAQNEAEFSCDDPTYTHAVAWAHLHLLGLLAENDSLLYAGIPWFNEGWGRDTFISLPGLLVTGHADVARKLLMRYAEWVDRNPASPTYGRIPNRVRPGEEIAYNTADGTPWWILGLYNYALYSHDAGLFSVLLADSTTPDSIVDWRGKPYAGALRVAIQGALSRSDSLGFLTHGDADTWMDAVGPQGAVTPRGNRAVEIQALHYASLQAAIRMSQIAFGKKVNPEWIAASNKIQKNFLSGFMTPAGDRFFDRLRQDGVPDPLLRPNQLFAVTIPNLPLLPKEIERNITTTVCKELVHPYGVLSLSPQEKLFHPYHIDEHYPKDDAYHNGVVWVWLSGPAKTALVREGRADLALQMADYEAKLMLTRGCVGTLPELLDGMPHKGQKEPNLAGTVSQTWSIAEFLRSTYQDILGIRPLEIQGGKNPFWYIDPRIPVAWGKTQARINMEGIPVLFTVQNFGDSMCVTLKAEKELKNPIGIKAFDVRDGITGFLNTTEPIRLVYKSKESTAYADGTPTAKIIPAGWPYAKGNQDIAFAKPITQTDFPVLQPPPWDVLSDKDVVKKLTNVKVILSAADSTGDDHGTGDFVYPSSEYFKPGILDFTKFELSEDNKSYNFRLTFRNLIQPGWHPEYGFQLTYLAICLHDGVGTRTSVGANSGYSLSEQDAASRIIYVGGGISVQDDNGKTLCTFTPRANSEAFGDTTLKQISFSLPKKYFPKPNDQWAWTILVGAQDDHGGAGMGEFRTVKPVVEQWAGGGNKDNSPNIYDIMKIPARKTN